MATVDSRQDTLDFEFLQGTLGEKDASSLKGSVDPIVYKLVRVEGDGTFVPATEDEVEHLFDNERDQKFPKARRKHLNSQNMAKASATEDSPSSDTFTEDGDVTGLSEPDDAEAERRKLHAKLQFLEVMLQRINEEERLRMASGIPGHYSRFRLNNTSSNNSKWDHSRGSPDSVSHVLSADAPFHESPSPVNSGSVDEHAVLDLGKSFVGSPPPQVDAIAKPDSNAVNNEICLDNLSIRELHEAFRRTFGRETSVKDKQWLKRRISMGLNSPRDVANNNAVLENKLSGHKKIEKDFSFESRHVIDQRVHSLPTIQPINTKVAAGSAFESFGRKQPRGKIASTTSFMEVEKVTNGFDDEFVGHGMRAGKRLRKPKAEYGENLEVVDAERMAGKTVRRPKPEYIDYDEDFDTEKIAGKRVRKPKVEYGEYDEVFCSEKTAGKRMRKPTRRYIEELSEEEPRAYSGRTVPAVRDSGHGHSPLKSRVRPPFLNGVEGMALVTRQDSLGGSGIQVPFVSRVRRGRPRKNCTSLLKYNPSGMAAKLVKKALSVRAARYDGDGADMKWRTRVPSESVEQTVDENSQNDENMLLPVSTEDQSFSDPLDYDMEEDNSDDYVATVPTAKGGTRRKHHRAWTLGEVMKLVEGVSRCGAGRWSEIKRLAFSAYGHRTSVDLKDKWRNLLRASYAQLQSNKEGRSQRKHASVPIPAPILVRVRELAATQSRSLGTPNCSSVSRSGRTVHKKLPV